MNVMLVDDSTADRFFIKKILSKDKLITSIIEVENGQACIDLFRQKRPDVLLLDYSLPDYTGLEILELLNKQEGFNETRVIFLTGQGNESIAVKAMQSGAADYLTKNNLNLIELNQVLRRTERIFQAELKVRERQKKIEMFYHLMDSSSDILMILNLDSQLIEFANSQCRQLFDFKSDIQDSTPLSELISKVPEFYFLNDEWQKSKTGREKILVVPVIKHIEKKLFFEFRIQLKELEKSNFITIVGRNITQHDALEKLLKKQNHHDPLTGVYNRGYFDEYLAKELNRATRYNNPLSLLMLDIDNFKSFNDTHGHQFGDECIRQISATADACLERASEFVARYGGEEFAVVAPMADKNSASIIAEKIRSAISAIEFKTNKGVNCSVTVSIGVKTYHSKTKASVNDLIEAADVALYEAKASGKNRVVIAK